MSRESRLIPLFLATAVVLSGSLVATGHATELRIEHATKQGDAGARSDANYGDGIYVFKRRYLESYPENAWKILTGPARYDHDDWTNVGLVLGITGAFLIADEAFKELVQDELRNETTDDVFHEWEKLGDRNNLGFAAIGLYAAAEVFGAEREKAASLMALESLILTTALVAGSKYLFGRDRPTDTDDAFAFQGPKKDDINASFPSGHAAHSFAIASVIDSVYSPDNPWVPYVAYPAAAGVAYARLNKNRHWVSDVFVGGAIGYFVGKMVTEANPFLEEQGVTMTPFSSQGATGVAFNYKF